MGFLFALVYCSPCATKSTEFAKQLFDVLRALPNLVSACIPFSLEVTTSILHCIFRTKADVFYKRYFHSSHQRRTPHKQMNTRPSLIRCYIFKSISKHESPARVRSPQQLYSTGAKFLIIPIPSNNTHFTELAQV